MQNATFSGQTKIPLGEFFYKLLNGSAQGILIGVLPAAVMKYIIHFSGIENTVIGADFSSILTFFTSLTPFLIGMSVALQFKMKNLDIGVVGIATMVSSSAVRWRILEPGGNHPLTDEKLTEPTRIFMTDGSGDIINAILVAGIAVAVIWLVARYLNGFGSVAIILSPILIGGGVGLLGEIMAPWVAMLTTATGKGVEWLTNLAPLPMAILIAMAFAIIIITPISTVGIGLAIGLHGLAAGAAGMGVVATTIVLLINSWRVNNKGTTIAIGLGAMNLMMPAVFKKPITMVASLFTAALAALPVVFFNIQGTPTSAGFGYIGLVSPIQSVTSDSAAGSALISHYISPAIALLAWVVIPLLAGFLAQFIFSKLLQLYTPEDFKHEL
ncbi:PTS sugar transporter subunit IIC [Eupransor demetentiae]|uniref:PTS_EIIC_2 domain (Does not regulate perfringolysin expression) (PfoR) n=1 Tax=Eupransor demetentiae TaxID=3109584 RepID=A0ABM9N630_9LACO|nr:Membrane regulatory protein PfoR [Lactobacillaceae bacterium LMG 33000]